jgi:hypothetical protein
MSEREETRAEIHHSVLCVAIGKLNVQVGWTSAKEELLDRMPSGLHSVVHDVLDNSGNVSARDMLRAVRIGALRPGNGTLQHKDAVLDQTIAWAFIVVCVVFSLLIGIQIFSVFCCWSARWCWAPRPYTHTGLRRALRAFSKGGTYERQDRTDDGARLPCGVTCLGHQQVHD